MLLYRIMSLFHPALPEVFCLILAGDSFFHIELVHIEYEQSFINGECVR